MEFIHIKVIFKFVFSILKTQGFKHHVCGPWTLHPWLFLKTSNIHPKPSSEWPGWRSCRFIITTPNIDYRCITQYLFFYQVFVTWTVNSSGMIRNPWNIFNLREPLRRYLHNTTDKMFIPLPVERVLISRLFSFSVLSLGGNLRFQVRESCYKRYLYNEIKRGVFVCISLI